MRVVHFDRKKEEAKVLVETPEDLWYLSRVIDAGDSVKGKTVRKIKAVVEGGDAIKKTIFLALSVEKLDLSPDVLRISGKVLEGPEDVPHGSHHTFSVEQGSTITITKEDWPNYQLNLLREASEAKPPKILICVFDREDALFASMTRTGYDLLSKLRGDVAKKQRETKAKGDFYQKIIEQLEQYDERFKLDKIVIASPSFWKEDLLKVLKNDSLRKKLIQATCSSVDEGAISEVLKREELREALRQERTSREMKLVEQAMSEIAKAGKVSYGIDAVENAVMSGAVETLMVTDKLIEKSKAKNSFERINTLMKFVEKAKGEIFIISSDHSGGRQLDGIGGIAALLRYKLYAE